MIFFLIFLFYFSTAFCVFSLLYLIYEKLKKKDSFKGLLFFIIGFLFLFFSENRASNSIINEIIFDIRTGRLILEENNFITKSDLLTLQYSSQKHNFSKKTYGVTVLPTKDDLLFKKDITNGKYWLFYTKYFFSTKIAVGYIEKK